MKCLKVLIEYSFCWILLPTPVSIIALILNVVFLMNLQEIDTSFPACENGTIDYYNPLFAFFFFFMSLPSPIDKVCCFFFPIFLSFVNKASFSTILLNGLW